MLKIQETESPLFPLSVSNFQSEISTTFGQFLRNLREERGISKRNLALTASIDRKAIRLYEGDEVIPRLNVLKNLTEELGFTPEDTTVFSAPVIKPQKNSLGEFIRDRRKNYLRESQNGLAEKIETSVDALRNLEKGIVTPNITIFKRMQRPLGFVIEGENPFQDEIFVPTFGEFLLQQRKKLRIGQRGLGKMLGLSQASVLNYEKGTSVPTKDLMKRMEEVFSSDYYHKNNSKRIYVGQEKWTDESNIGFQVRQLRHERKWSQEELADYAGVQQRVISAIELGKTESAYLLSKIFKAFEMAVPLY